MAAQKTLEELARLVGGRVEGDGSRRITGVNTIDEASDGEITFLASAKYARRAAGTRASAIIVADEKADFKGVDLLVVENPQKAFAEMIALFCPSPKPPPGIHASAFVHPDAVVGEGVYVGPFAFIDEGVSIGRSAQIHPGVFIGRGSEVGDDTVVYSNVSVREGSRIGKRVIIHCNSVIGSDGFGYAKVDSKYLKVPQAGTVTIGDDVEIGASVTIDRATVGVTSIGRGTKIDNLVQIAHNVKVGEDTVIVSQVGISGSTKVGSRVTLAGQVGVAGHIEIADDCTIGAKSGVSNTIKDKGIFTGYPPLPHGEWLRATALFARLPELKKRIEELEERLKELES